MIAGGQPERRSQPYSQQAIALKRIRMRLVDHIIYIGDQHHTNMATPQPIVKVCGSFIDNLCESIYVARCYICKQVSRLKRIYCSRTFSLCFDKDLSSSATSYSSTSTSTTLTHRDRHVYTRRFRRLDKLRAWSRSTRGTLYTALWRSQCSPRSGD